MSTDRLAIARWLLEAGAGHSARQALTGLRGAAANRLRVAARGTRLRPCIYGLARLATGGGIVVPLEPEVANLDPTQGELERACDHARSLVAAELAEERFPALRLPVAQRLPAFGDSIGLAAALAYAVHAVRSDHRPEAPWLATGRLGPNGAVLPVDGLADKLAAAAAETRNEGGVLVPAGSDAASELGSAAIPVATLREALTLVLGPPPWRTLPDLCSVDDLLERSRREPEHLSAVALLAALPKDGLAAADRGRLELATSSRLRHAGRTEEARHHYEAARDALRAAGRVVGAEAVERFELEHWMMRMAEYALDEVSRELLERLERPFLLLRNEVRCRGMLAQVLSMQGDHARAIEVRRDNLPLQRSEDWLRRVLPGTYCYLLLDSARVGIASDFTRYAGELAANTELGDAYQWRFNLASILRGAVLLGRDVEALTALRTGTPLDDIELPCTGRRLLLGTDPIATNPEVSTARALCRALWRTGEPVAAAALVARVSQDASAPRGLLRWVQLVTHVERAIALHHAADPSAERILEDVRTQLRLVHPHATRHHRQLLTATWDTLPAAVDQVWY